MGRLAGLIVFLVALGLFFSQPTDADLSVSRSVAKNVLAASTLDFSKRDTANNEQEQTLFMVNGLVPGGFAVESLRIKNEGRIKFAYLMSVERRSGDEVVFNNLKIKILKNWQVIYEGLLKDLKINVKNSLETDDLVMILGLDSNADDLKDKQCDFYLVIRTDNENLGSNFFVEQKIDNLVNVGKW